MPARTHAENQPETAEPEPQPEPAPPKQAAFTDQGELPAVGGAAKSAAPTASEQAYGDTPALDSGLLEITAYKAACEHQPGKWQEKYAMGHTSASQWQQPYEGRYAFEFHLKKGASAADAVKDFVKGPTIADYRAIGVALEMDELRDSIGDQLFDRYFGSRDTDTDASIPAAHRLSITSAMYTIPFAEQMKAIVADGEARLRAAQQEPEPVVAMKEREERPKVQEDVAPVVESKAEEAKREVV